MNRLQPRLAIAADIARCIGVRRGMRVLDFGCGGGIYSLSIAESVGARGLVYSIDKDHKALRRLRDRARARRITNIRPLKADGSCDIALATQSVDLVLLFDMLHDHYFTTEQRRDLFEEVCRVLKRDGLLAIFPNHIDPEQVAELILYPVENLGFSLEQKIVRELIHDESVSEGTTFVFRWNR